MLLNNAKTNARTSVVNRIKNVCVEDVWAKSAERDLKALAPALPAQCRWKLVYVHTSVSGNPAEAAQEWLMFFGKKLVTDMIFTLNGIKSSSQYGWDVDGLFGKTGTFAFLLCAMLADSEQSSLFIQLSRKDSK